MNADMSAPGCVEAGHLGFLGGCGYDLASHHLLMDVVILVIESFKECWPLSSPP